MIFMSVGAATLAGAPCQSAVRVIRGRMVSRFRCPRSARRSCARLLLAQPEVAPIGLGARDSLRLEAGLCLYSHDIDATTTLVEAGLAWALSKSRRAGGARPGGYPGAETIMRELQTGVARKRVGLLSQGRMPVREGTELVDADGARRRQSHERRLQSDAERAGGDGLCRNRARSSWDQGRCHGSRSGSRNRSGCDALRAPPLPARLTDAPRLPTEKPAAARVHLFLLGLAADAAFAVGYASRRRNPISSPHSMHSP